MGIPALGMRALPGSNQRQGRTDGRVRQEQRDRWQNVPFAGGPARAFGLVEPGERRQAASQDDPRAADPAFPPRGGDAARLAGGASFILLHPRVPAEGQKLDTNRYSVPWRYIGQEVTVEQCPEVVRIYLGGRELASHPKCMGSHGKAISKIHLKGIVGADPDERASRKEPEPMLLRPLAEYQAIVEGGRYGCG